MRLSLTPPQVINWQLNLLHLYLTYFQTNNATPCVRTQLSSQFSHSALFLRQDLLFLAKVTPLSPHTS